MDRRRPGAVEEGYQGQDHPIYEHPAVAAMYNRAGLLDVVAVLCLIFIGMQAHRKTPYQRDVVDHHDPALSYPYHSHVRYPEWPWLPFISLLVPALVLLGLRLISIIFYSMVAIPAVQRRFPRLAQDVSGWNTQPMQQTGIRELLVETGKWMYIDGFAILATASLTYAVVETAKVWFGGLRPDFLSRCEWDPIYGKCTGDEKLINDGRKSFPSGHATYSFSAMTLLTCVLFHKSAQMRRSFFTALLYLLPLVWAVRICVTRWWENRHGAMDLVAGTILGTAIAMFCYHIFYRYRTYSGN